MTISGFRFAKRYDCDLKMVPTDAMVTRNR